MNNKDIRWHQRLSNYNKALAQFNKAINIANERELTELEQQGLIQSFEFTHELAWNVMKDYFFYQGNPEIRGSRDATREAFKFNLISTGEIWMDMIISRNKTTHTYDEDTANEIVSNILNDYVQLFNDFSVKMIELREGEQQDLFEEE
ncbi:nucleotidyltransferase substrate binding protein [Aquimarina muelleri]|uniref:Nucleotidyltransferase n=1 Tax=Aquimarina muelleri TaxID=279356 RepID=A0A918JQU7_9FLAO|nr:nucleotidyltransferase substrate binding protein [Aquimarina muelleri]MCX2763080.1 nucleotidyltransferase substrate binding protein [Aquimarina muelleri]GGX02931.1 nucleotidyltransferase [Aquimarina muelleri]